MEHKNRLLCGRIVSMFHAKFFNDSPRLHLRFVDLEKSGDRSGLLSSEQSLTKFCLAEVSLIHLGCGSHNPKGNLFRFTKSPQPFPKPLRNGAVYCFSVSSHLLARYRLA